MKDYNSLNWWSKERKEHYTQVNSSNEKLLGNKGEQIVKDYLIKSGWTVRDSSAAEDANQHADFFVWFEDRWQAVDVKHQARLTLEIRNHWGNPGTTILRDGEGADIVMHLIQGTNTVYFYRRSEMRRWWYSHPGLHRFSTRNNNSVIFTLYPKTLKEIPFIQVFKIEE